MTHLVIEPGKTQAAGSSNSPLFAIVDLLAEGFMALETWRRRHKASQQFARIESRVLRDLGISEAQRFIEVNKAFWEK
ncbi:MAG TPA: hypothetical protein VKB27_22420 [Gammaproteobacteria bacterium]|nr:hypothetical protein [Gammaproteobacteria bacterium]